MISSKLAITILIILSSLYTESFINSVTVFKRPNQALKRHNYIITCGDIHEGLSSLNTGHIKGIQEVIYNSDPAKMLFLVEDIASMKTDHPLLNDVVEAIKTTYRNPNTKTKIPLVTLIDYASKNKKSAINLDDRAHTLIQTIFYYLVMTYIQKFKYSLTSQQKLSLKYQISFPEIGFVLKELLKNFEHDYSQMHTKLKSLEHASLAHQSIISSDAREIADIKNYIEFYNSFSHNIEQDKKYTDDLIIKNFDLIDYYVKKYKSYKNSETLNLESPIDGFNFNLFVGADFLSRMLNFGSYTVELKALKSIIENLNSKTKIFVFTGQKHIENLNQVLEKMSFKNIYHKVQTANINTIYANITHHILKAESLNNLNNNYILQMKQNLAPIDSNFFNICQKRHLHAKDFKDLK